MERVVILNEKDMEQIGTYIQQIDIEIADIYNKSIPSNLKNSMVDINRYVQELGKILGVW